MRCALLQWGAGYQISFENWSPCYCTSKLVEEPSTNSYRSRGSLRNLAHNTTIHNCPTQTHKKKSKSIQPPAHQHIRDMNSNMLLFISYVTVYISGCVGVPPTVEGWEYFLFPISWIRTYVVIGFFDLACSSRKLCCSEMVRKRQSLYCA